MAGGPAFPVFVFASDSKKLGAPSSRGLRGWDRVNLDRPWCCLFSYGFLQLVYSILGKGELDAIIASYLIKAKSKNRVPDILESHPRNTGEDGAPSAFLQFRKRVPQRLKPDFRPVLTARLRFAEAVPLPNLRKPRNTPANLDRSGLRLSSRMARETGGF